MEASVLGHRVGRLHRAYGLEIYARGLTRPTCENALPIDNGKLSHGAVIVEKSSRRTRDDEIIIYDSTGTALQGRCLHPRYGSHSDDGGSGKSGYR